MSDDAADGQEVAAPAEHLPAVSDEIRDLFGGRRGVIESIAPVFAFVAVNAARDLRTAVWAAVAVAAVLLVVRLAQKQSPRYAIGGFLGIAVASWFAKKTGRAENFFLPGILLNYSYALALLGSVAIGHPVFGALWKLLTSHPDAWHDHPRVRRTFREVTLAWGTIFLVRAVAQTSLWLAHKPGWLFVVRIVGTGVYLVAAALTFPYIERRASGVSAEVGASP